MALTDQTIWLASYPKSGNTWVRFMLANIFSDCRSNSEKLKDCIPDTHDTRYALTYASDRVNVVKTHYLWDNLRLIPMDNTSTDKCIYVVRNPFDVIASNYNYLLLLQGKCRTITFEAYVKEFVKYEGDPRWFTLGIGSWSQHIDSWFSAPLQRLLVRYEDIHLAPRRQLKQILEFLQVDVSTDLINNAVEVSHFESMKAIEDKEIEQDKNKSFFNDDRYADGHADGVRFMNVGKANYAMDLLNLKQRNMVENRFCRQLRLLGYM